jgi:hypothetical protein
MATKKTAASSKVINASPRAVKKLADRADAATTAKSRTTAKPSRAAHASMKSEMAAAGANPRRPASKRSVIDILAAETEAKKKKSVRTTKVAAKASTIELREVRTIGQLIAALNEFHPASTFHMDAANTISVINLRGRVCGVIRRIEKPVK